MPSYTTRLGLAKPTDGENYDVDIVNVNSDAIDQAIGARNITSTTRPATPYIGQLIFETDTKRALVWEGSRWMIITGSDLPLARMRVTALSIGNSPLLPNWLNWNRFDNAYFDRPAANPNLFTVKEAGIYSVQVWATITLGAGALCSIRTEIRTNNDDHSVGTGALGQGSQQQHMGLTGSVSTAQSNVVLPAMRLNANTSIWAEFTSLTSGVGATLTEAILVAKKLS